MRQILDTFKFFNARLAQQRPRVAISACLMGKPVRYDGTDKLLETTSTFLSNYLSLIPICPEVDSGMPVPRPPIQLVTEGPSIFTRGRDDKTLNPTNNLVKFRQHSLQQHAALLCAYILKSRSPSCGINTTPIFDVEGNQVGVGSGLQADYFQRKLPWLLMCDELQLSSISDNQRFILCCYILADMQLAADQLDRFHQHYQWLWQQMAVEVQTKLSQAVSQKESYWEQFKDELWKLEWRQLTFL